MPMISSLARTRDRVLVTGGFGFLGGHVLDQLLAGDVDVHVIDDLSSNPIDVPFLLDELGSPRNLTYEVRSVADFMTDDPGPYDQIIHLASVVGPAGVISHAGRIVPAIVHEAHLLADHAIGHGARLLFVSTSEVYGGGREGLCAEGDVRVVPAEPSCRLEYAVAKLAAETALLNRNALGDLDVVIVRPFNIAGPRQSGEGGFVLPRFLAQAWLGLPLTIFGDGSARRAFTHVADTTDGIIRALRRGTAGAAYNLGNPSNTISVSELANVVLEVTGSDAGTRRVDPSKIYGAAFTEANEKFPAPGRAVDELGWNPDQGVEAIVRDTWQYFLGADPDTRSRLAGSKVLEQLAMSGGASSIAIAS